MRQVDPLIELLARVGANCGEPVLIGSQELSTWPVKAAALLKTHKLLMKAQPATSVVCPGCERQCVMPVHLAPIPDGGARAFTVCDKRSDINRVAVPIDHLKQWQSTGDAIASLLATLLDLQRVPGAGLSTGRWEVGMFKGTKHSSHLVLLANGELRLLLAGHSVAVRDVLELKGDGLEVDRRKLTRLVDQPISGAGDIESADRRKARLQARRNALKQQGDRAFLKTMAAEEECSVQRIKQILSRAAPKEPVSKARKRSPNAGLAS